MMVTVSDWRETKIGEIVEFLDYRRVPLSGQERQQRQGPYPYYGASGVIDHIDDYIFEGKFLLVAEDGENLNSRKLPVAFFASGKFWVNNHAHIIQALKDAADDYFIKAWFDQANISGYITGAAQPKLSQENLKRIQIKLPPLPTQKKIAAILSAYDDLIENNNRRIRILEEMAQLIYWEWFVNFRFPGHENVGMVDSPLGKMPESWNMDLLSNYAEFNKGFEPGSENYYTEEGEDRVPFLRVGDLGSRQSEIFIAKELGMGHILQPNDIAITMDGTVGLVKIGLSGAYSSGIRKVVIKKERRLGWGFTYFLLKSDQIQGIIQSHAKGTTIKHASSSTDHMSFILPSVDVMVDFENCVSTILKLILSLSNRNEILIYTRDLLLQKLISREIDVSELEIEISEAAV